MSKYTLVQRPFPPLYDGPKRIHSGTGVVVGKKNVVDPHTVSDVQKDLEFPVFPYSITVMSFEIETAEAPNWFGVGFRRGIRTFDSVNLFCHPHPGIKGADMTDATYHARSGNWPKLFRYVELLASQLDMAQSNQILIVPFFNNASYGSTGLFGPNWKDILEQIIAQVAAYAQLASAANALRRAVPPPLAAAGKSAIAIGGAAAAVALAASRFPPLSHAVALNNVVLSDFSRGRQLMWLVRNSCSGMNAYLREIWDFDGNGGPTPSSGRVRAIRYDQADTTVAVADSLSFHVHGRRWFKYHQRRDLNVHSNIPDMLAFHAAKISNVK